MKNSMNRLVAFMAIDLPILILLRLLVRRNVSC